MSKANIFNEYGVEISDIEIDDYHYSFQYKIWKNHEVVEEGTHHSDHSRMEDKKLFMEELIDGWAESQVMVSFFEQIV